MDELLGRKIPYSAPAEQAVIGSMLIDPRCVPEVLEKLKPDEFYLQLNRDIYETIYAMFSYSQAIDPVTVLGQMKERLRARAGMVVRGRARLGLAEWAVDSLLKDLMGTIPTNQLTGKRISIPMRMSNTTVFIFRCPSPSLPESPSLSRRR